MRWATWLVALAAAALLLCVLSTESVARDDGWTREIVSRGAPMTRRLAVAFDVTGSMDGKPAEKAARELLTIASLFPDDGLLKVWAFRVSALTVPGQSAPGQSFAPCVAHAIPWRPEWTQLPDSEAIDELAKWLAATGCGGGTDLVTGVAAALEADGDDLSVILVSDGEQDGGPEQRDAAVAKIIELAKKRAAPVHAIAVCADPDSYGIPIMTAIARETGGACVVWRGARR